MLEQKINYAKDLEIIYEKFIKFIQCLTPGFACLGMYTHALFCVVIEEISTENYMIIR